MNFATKFGLNLMQKAGLDRIVISLINNKRINSLMLGHCWQHKGYKHFYGKYLIWRERLQKNGVSLAGQKILEVGSGASLGLAYFFLNQSYESWLASDFFQILSSDAKAVKREIKLIKKIAAKHYADISGQVRIAGDKISFGPKFNFMKLNLAEFEPKLGKSFDLILSSNVLEHLEEETVAPAVKNLSFYLKIGGLMIHEIDLRDHVNVANPHGFLKYDKAAWDKLTRGTIFYTNRLRLKDYLKILTNCGLKVRWLETESQVLPPKLKISEEFKKYAGKELEIFRAFIILEKL